MKIFKAIGWLVIPYVMIFVYWKRIGTLHKVLGSVWALTVILAAIIQPVNIPQKPSVTPTTNDVKTPTPVTKTKTPATLDDSVKTIVVSNLGEKTNDGQTRIVSIKINDNLGRPDNINKPPNDRTKIVLITLNGNTNLSENLTHKGLWMDSVPIIRAIFDNKQVDEMGLEWQLPLTDKYGNTAYNSVMQIDYTRDIVSKINWDGFIYENIPKTAAKYWEHPAFKK